LRIVHVIGSLNPASGGPSKACVEMAQATAARGHDVSVHTTTHGLAARPSIDRPPLGTASATIHYHRVHAPRRWLTSLPMIRPLRAAIRRADVVHLHSLYLFHDWVTGALCRRFGTPYVVRPHGTLDPYLFRRHRRRKRVVEALFQTRVLREAAAIHYASAEEARLAEPLACGTRAIVIPNGVNVEDYASFPAPGTFRSAHPEIGARKIVLFLGRLNFKKGLDVLADAFGRLTTARDDLHLVIAGPDDGEERRARRWLADARALARTTFTGMLTGETKLAAFHDSDLFVLPSYSENFGFAVVEAMACGLPVVISDQVNIWREIAAAGAGRVTSLDPAQLAPAIAAYVDDSSAARQAGRNGQALVTERFQWTKIAVALEAMYRDVAHSQGPWRTRPGPAQGAQPMGRQPDISDIWS
jgi:glycosyltransferase involved in cell wall biosynthesis